MITTSAISFIPDQVINEDTPTTIPFTVNDPGLPAGSYTISAISSNPALISNAPATKTLPAGIVLGGSGNGEAIVANKVRGIRCALCWSLDTARWAREHNDANVLAIGQRTISAELALEIVRVWLTTPFAGGRHTARVRQIEV